MHIRKPLLAAGLALAAALPSPSLAQDARTAELAERLNDPMTQYAVAGMISAMTKALLEMEIAPFAKAMKGMGGNAAPDLPPDATVGDPAGTHPDEVRDELVERVPEMMSAMGGMAVAFEEMMPRFRDMAEKMKDAMPTSE